jgi:pyruvate,water dikinase
MKHAALTLTFSEVSAADLPRVGGKGANLGVLARGGIPVPPGFCVTTEAFDRFVRTLPDATAHFARLDALDGSSVDSARSAAEAMRRALHALPMPSDVAAAIIAGWQALGTGYPLAVRSSATAEDLPGASFAGQQDTYLNVVGEAALLDAVRRCWISLFTDRAVLYRARNGFGHRSVRLGVVVQQLVDPDVSGILFTADPVTGHRQIASIDAGFGLGEALVGGLISADLYQVDRRRNQVLLARPGDKAFAIRSTAGGGTRREEIPDSLRRARALDDAQVRALAQLGGRIEALYGGAPQDIEWCIAGGTIFIVQARPITSLFPIPESAVRDGGLRIFISFGHLQMMHDALPRLTQEVWRLFFPAGKRRWVKPDGSGELSAAVAVAGSRLFIDMTPMLRVPMTRKLTLGVLGHAYEALANHLIALTDRPEFRAVAGAPLAVLRALARALGPALVRLPPALLWRDPVSGAAELGRAVRELPEECNARILAASSHSARIRQSSAELATIFRRVRHILPRLLAGALAHRFLARMAQGRWADPVRGEVDVLLRGLPGNVTTEMDLAVGDLVDLVRPHPELAELLRSRPWPEARELARSAPDGRSFLAALDAFLARYGDRVAGEIDISRQRWRDDPALLIRVVLGGAATGPTGAHRRQHQAQVEAGEAAGRKLIAAASRGAFGFLRGRIVRRLVRVARIGLGLREHPKFMLVQILGRIRAEALAAGEVLAARGQLGDGRDVWHVGFDEVAQALDDATIDLKPLVDARAAELKGDRVRKPPIVISSDGETPTLAARANLPDGALAGTAASAGVVEGVARVVTDPEREVLREGEILVAPFTDPGWTPLFIHAAGLVTEVGGLMTHGAVVAREYGIPAVVSVASAVERIRTGQRIRVDGTRGYVQILETP